MAIVPPPATKAPPSTCPLCWETSTFVKTYVDEGVSFASYLCANRHIWLTKWVAA